MRLRLRPHLSLVIVGSSLAMIALSVLIYSLQHGQYPFARLRGRRWR